MAYIRIAIPYILQVLLIIHVVKTGRERYWIYLLIIVPFSGVIYALIEVLPGFLNSRSVHQAQKSVINAVLPVRNIKKLEELANHSPTVINKKNLAEAYFSLQRFQDAATWYEKCLGGPFGDDHSLMHHYSAVLTELGDHQKALDLLKTVAAEGEEYMLGDVHLLIGKNQEALDRQEEAEEGYQIAAAKGAGLMYQVLYGQYLTRQGKREEGKAVFQDITTNYPFMPRHGKKLNRKWYYQAKEELRSLG